MNRRTRVARVLVAACIGLLVPVAGFVTAGPAEAASAPSGLKAAAVATKGVRLTWSGKATGYYRVRFSKSASMSNAVTWNLTGNTMEWTRTVADPTASGSRLSPGASYYFQVKSIDASKSSLSDYSKAIKVTLPRTGKPELAPGSVRATPAGPNALHLSWSTAGPGVSYRVRYTTSSSLSITKWKYTDFTHAGGILSGLKPGTAYTIRLRVISPEKAALSNYSATLRATTAASGSDPVRVMSYNITKTGSGPSWESRRDAVAATIADQDPEILGLQEAVPNQVVGASGSTVPQYTDVLSLLDGKYAYATIGSSSGTRLAYDTTRFAVVDSGIKRLTTLGTATRYAVWAILKERSSGDPVFVVDTHLEPGTVTDEINAARALQAEEILALIEEKRPDGVPVILLGDMNSSRSTVPNRPYEVFTQSLIDPVGEASDTWRITNPGVAEHRVDLEYKSYNDWLPKAPRNTCPVGTRLDWILVSEGLRVAEARTVVRLDTTGTFIGTIPSDHNPVMVTVHLS